MKSYSDKIFDSAKLDDTNVRLSKVEQYLFASVVMHCLVAGALVLHFCF
jgi:hypothetical protein